MQLLQAGAAQDTSHPQVGAAAQPLSQQLLLFFLNSLPSKPPQLRFLLPQPLSQPQGSQATTSQPQEGAQASAISHPQVGAAPQPQGSQAATSQPQVGSAQQPVSHPLSQPLPHPRSDIFLSCILLKKSSRGLRRGLLQPVSQPQGSQATTSQPQEGAQASAQAVSHPQDGSQAVAHPLPQAEISQPQVGSAEQPVSQQALSQPEPFKPSM